jgi:dethiobiotin synthetase
MDYFVSAIHTDSGKTLVSSILCEALGADYWKPIQSGLPRDTETVAGRINYGNQRIHPEAYLLKTPVSPHQAAELDGLSISLETIHRPNTNKPLVVEGAGGLMVPIASKLYIIDLIRHLNLPVILVSNYYLGSINHTLLSLQFLKNSGLTLKGIVFNGAPNPYSKQAIMEYSDAPCLLDVPILDTVNSDVISRLAQQLKANLDAKH